jgi:hypothetical protein
MGVRVLLLPGLAAAAAALSLGRRQQQLALADQHAAARNTGPTKIIGGTPLDPLTGVPIDPHTGLPVPGRRGFLSNGAALRQQLIATVQTATLSTSTLLGEVVDRFVQTDCDLASQ